MQCMQIRINHLLWQHLMLINHAHAHCAHPVLAGVPAWGHLQFAHHLHVLPLQAQPLRQNIIINYKAKGRVSDRCSRNKQQLLTDSAGSQRVPLVADWAVQV